MKAMIVALAATLLSAILAVAPAHAQPQCPITCSSGVCSNDANVTCTTNADCIGAAVAAACPCAGTANAAGQTTAWKNHGQYQSCVMRASNVLRKEGCSTAGVASCSARSTCGKAAAVLCCKVSTGMCTIPSGSTTGSCSNKPELACSTDADCTVVSEPHRRKDATSCTRAGGYVSGTGSVCSGCTPPVACCVPSSVAGQPGTCEVLTASDCAGQQGTPTGSAPSCSGVTCP